MVDAAKAHNPFANTTQAEVSNCCPHMARLGICLEPEMCFLIHNTSEPSGQSAAQMSTAAKAFNPFAAASPGTGGGSKEFVPQQQEQSAQAGIIQMLSRMGLEA